MKSKADLIICAGQVVTCAGSAPKRGRDMLDVHAISPGAVAVVGERIAMVASRNEVLGSFAPPEDGLLDFPKAIIAPGLIDAHSHPLFAGSRVEEYLKRAQGVTYQEIQASGGGIASTVQATSTAPDDELMERLLKNLRRMLIHGTTTAEVKSGYGLSTEREMRMLRLFRAALRRQPVELVPTILAAHCIPPDFLEKREEYLALLLEEMLPRAAGEALAEFADVFCDEGAFSREESALILSRAKDLGLGLRIHAEQFTRQRGAMLAVELGGASCDHVVHLSEEDIQALAASDTVAVVMPGTELFLHLEDFAPARSIIDSGAILALGTDFNAGSCLSESLPMAMSLSVLKMRLKPEEAINAATVNSAFSVRRHDRVGSLQAGKQADLLLLDCGDYREWLYHFGVNMSIAVVKKGKVVWQNPGIVGL